MTAPIEPGASGPAPAGPGASWVRMAVDYAGPAAFLAGYFLSRNILTATWALVVVSVLAVAAGFAVQRRIAPLPLIWAAAALVFGVATLVFHDPRIVKMKTTIIDAVLGAAMLGGLAFGRSPIKILMGDTLSLSDATWRKLTLRFGLFFLLIAAANEIIWRTQPDAIWVLFRFPGLLIVSLLFSATQIPTMMRDGKLTQAALTVAESQE